MMQESQNRLDLLFEAVGDAGRILILPHNDPDPDAIASAVTLRHLLLRLEKSRRVVCMGVHRDVLILSVRTQSPTGGAEELVQAMVGDEGTAGGHGLMAGGQVPLKGRDPEQVVHLLRQRALRVLQVPPEVRGERLI